MYKLACYLSFVDWVRVAQVTSGFMTPVIAALAVTIAFNQYQVNRLQHRLALFDKRMKVFVSATDFVRQVMRTGSCSLDMLHALMSDTRDCMFLFGPEMVAYIDELHGRGVELTAIRLPAQADRLAEVLSAFQGEFKSAENKFAPYLNFRRP